MEVILVKSRVVISLDSSSLNAGTSIGQHGTGTSSSVPNISCLTREKPCNTCWSTFNLLGKKNIRRNTGALFRLSPGGPVVVVDVGKTFLTSALEWFPKYGLRTIAAVVLTHAHADAMNGLDDLRGWTLRGAIQSHIDVYLSPDTFQEVKRSFPYLVAKEYATGGGDVPVFHYHFFQDGIPFDIDNLFTVTPIAVHHGRYFTQSQDSSTVSPTPPYTPTHSPAVPAITPYVSYGFIIDAPSVDSSIVYISDVSNIPESTWTILLRPRPSPRSTPLLMTRASLAQPSPSPSPSPPLQTVSPPRYPLLIIDCLRIEPHASHFGLSEAVEAARRMTPERTYLVGFSDELTHAEWSVIGEAIEQGVIGSHALCDSFITSRLAVSGTELKQWEVRDGGIRPEEVKRGLKIVKPGNSVWLRPAFDGMRVIIRNGAVTSADE